MRDTLDRLLVRIDNCFGYNLSIRFKIILIFMTLMLTVVGLFAGLSYASIAGSSSEQLLHSAELTFEQTSTLLEYRIKNIEYAADQVTLNMELNYILKKNPDGLPVADLMGDYQTVKSIVLSAYNSSTMYRLNVYLNSFGLLQNASQEHVLKETADVFSVKLVENTEWYRDLHSGSGRSLWALNSISMPKHEEQVVSYIRYIVDLQDYANDLGVIKIDILQSELDEIVSRANISSYGASFLVNSNGTVISSSGGAVSTEILTLVAGQHTESVSPKWKSMANGSIIGIQRIANTDWTLISVISGRDIRAAGNTLLSDVLIFMLVVVLIGAILVVFLAWAVTYRIRTLADHITQSGKSHSPIPVTVHGTDEVCVLTDSYNQMIEEMDRYSKLQFELGKNVEKAEMKALQVQINPHFLYNTLDIINFIALENGTYDICSVVQNLARFYKLSLSGGLDIVPVKNELDLIQSYVNLLNLKYEDSITLNIDVPEAIKESTILKLILQPIVENAILHGIQEKPEPVGTVSIKGFFEEGAVVLAVSDDGVGMSPEMLEQLRQGANSTLDHGYGIKNVVRRIQLHYGDDYRLRFESQPGKGTTVYIRVPYTSSEEG